MARRSSQVSLRDLFTSNPWDLLGRGNNDSGVAFDSQLSQLSQSQMSTESVDMPPQSQSPGRVCNRYLSRGPVFGSQSNRSHSSSSTADHGSVANVSQNRGLGLSQQQFEIHKQKAVEQDCKDLLHSILENIKELSTDVKATASSLKETIQLGISSTDSQTVRYSETLQMIVEKNCAEVLNQSKLQADVIMKKFDTILQHIIQNESQLNQQESAIAQEIRDNNGHLMNEAQSTYLKSLEAYKSFASEQSSKQLAELERHTLSATQHVVDEMKNYIGHLAEDISNITDCRVMENMLARFDGLAQSTLEVKNDISTALKVIQEKQQLQFQSLHYELSKSAEEQVRWTNQLTSELAQNIKQLWQQMETCIQFHRNDYRVSEAMTSDRMQLLNERPDLSGIPAAIGFDNSRQSFPVKLTSATNEQKGARVYKPQDSNNNVESASRGLSAAAASASLQRAQSIDWHNTTMCSQLQQPIAVSSTIAVNGENLKGRKPSDMFIAPVLHAEQQLTCGCNYRACRRAQAAPISRDGRDLSTSLSVHDGRNSVGSCESAVLKESCSHFTENGISPTGRSQPTFMSLSATTAGPENDQVKTNRLVWCNEMKSNPNQSTADINSFRRDLSSSGTSCQSCCPVNPTVPELNERKTISQRSSARNCNDTWKESLLTQANSVTFSGPGTAAAVAAASHSNSLPYLLRSTRVNALPRFSTSAATPQSNLPAMLKVDLVKGLNEIRGLPSTSCRPFRKGIVEPSPIAKVLPQVHTLAPEVQADVKGRSPSCAVRDQRNSQILFPPPAGPLTCQTEPEKKRKRRRKASKLYTRPKSRKSSGGHIAKGNNSSSSNVLADLQQLVIKENEGDKLKTASSACRSGDKPPNKCAPTATENTRLRVATATIRISGKKTSISPASFKGKVDAANSVVSCCCAVVAPSDTSIFDFCEEDDEKNPGGIFDYCRRKVVVEAKKSTLNGCINQSKPGKYAVLGSKLFKVAVDRNTVNKKGTGIDSSSVVRQKAAERQSMEERTDACSSTSSCSLSLSDLISF